MDPFLAFGIGGLSSAAPTVHVELCVEVRVAGVGGQPHRRGAGDGQGVPHIGAGRRGRRRGAAGGGGTPSTALTGGQLAVTK